jgi:4-amino-4-deoxy-L-arabinose transferase-like glycosyltransferase
MTNDQYSRWATLLLLAGFLWRGTIAIFLPAGFDEAYYYLYTQHLDWSYFDHPILVALSTGLGIWLTGHVSQFTLRWGALLLHTGALLLLYLTGKHLFSPKAGWLTLAIASLIPIFSLGFGTMTLPDAPLIFFWSASLYVASLEFFPRSPAPSLPILPSSHPPILTYYPTPRLALIGFLVGLACLGKYHGVALGFGLIGFCLTHPRYRTVFTSPWIVASALLFVLAISPILIWNAQHDWVSLRFQSGRAVPDRSYSLIDVGVTWLSGIAYLFPTFGLPLWWVSGRSLGSFATRTPKPLFVDSLAIAPYSLVLWLSLPLVLSFTLMGGYRVILPTWTAPGFWGLTLILGERASHWSWRWVTRWLWTSAGAIALLLLLALLHLNLGIFQQRSQFALLGGFVDPRTDASVQQIDIRQLRQGFAESNVLAKGEFLFTNDIYLAGQIGMAIAPLTSTPITCFDPDPRGFAFWSTTIEWVGKTGILVTSSQQSEGALTQYQAYFPAFQKLADLPILRGGEVVQTFQVYSAGKLQKPYPRPYDRNLMNLGMNNEVSVIINKRYRR